MPEYLSPGVYVEEANTDARSLQGVSTTTVGFVGQTIRGPLRPLLITNWMEFQHWYGGFTDPARQQGYLPHAVKGFFDNGGQRAFVARLPVDGQPEGRGAIGTSPLAAAAIGPGAWAKSVMVKVTKASLHSEKRSWLAFSVFYYEGLIPMADGKFLDPDDPDHRIKPGFRAPALSERFDNVSGDPDSPNYYGVQVNPASRLITLGAAAGAEAAAIAEWFKGSFKAPNAPPIHAPLTVPEPAAETVPKFESYGFQRYLGNDKGPSEQHTGLAALATIPEIAMLCVPDQALPALAKLTDPMIQHCENLRSRIAILGAGPDADVNALRPPSDTSFGACYFPWITIVDPRTNAPLSVPPTGHVAGMIARTDISRGVWKAPANESLIGPIIQDLGGLSPLSYKVTDAVQGVLNPRGVNCLRDFRDIGRGVRVWGARTMSSDSRWRYLNVRRLFIYVEQSIFYGTQWVVFEPNNPYTWNQVVSSVSGFLNTLWHNGGLMGATPEEAFAVRCDRTTMTQDDIDSGRLVCTVAIAPLKPAEFVIFRVSQKTAGAQRN